MGRIRTRIGFGKGGDGGGDASQTAYSKQSEVTIGGVTNGDIVGPSVKDALDKLFSAPYVSPTLNSLGIGVSSPVEIGYNLTSPINFSFTIQQGGARGVFLPNTLDILQSATVLASGLSVSSPKSQAITPTQFLLTTGSQSFTVRATDEKNTVISTSNTLTWQHSVYIGVAPVGNPSNQFDISFIDETWIKTNLTRSLTNSHPTSVSGNIGAGQRLYYAYPVSFGLRRFNTLIGPELNSLVADGSDNIRVRTNSQITEGVALIDGILYAICKNEQSNIGNTTFTLTTL